MRLVADHAGPLSQNLSRRLDEHVECEEFTNSADEDCPAFVVGKLHDVEALVPDIIDGLVELAEAVDEDEIIFVVEDIQEAVGAILESMKEVKCARFQGN